MPPKKLVNCKSCKSAKTTDCSTSYTSTQYSITDYQLNSVTYSTSTSTTTYYKVEIEGTVTYTNDGTTSPNLKAVILSDPCAQTSNYGSFTCSSNPGSVSVFAGKKYTTTTSIPTTGTFYIYMASGDFNTAVSQYIAVTCTFDSTNDTIPYTVTYPTTTTTDADGNVTTTTPIVSCTVTLTK